MEIRTYLDCSTGHAKQKDIEMLANVCGISSPPVIAINHQYGFWVHVDQDDFEASAKKMTAAGLSSAFVSVMRAAALAGCCWVNFDQDADPAANPEFPVFDW